jgi:hypothetical protein
LLLGLAFAFALAVFLTTTAALAGAVGKWESRVFREIPKGVWEPVETCFWFSPGFHAPAFSTAPFWTWIN